MSQTTWNFRRMHNTITFNNFLGNGCCVVSIDVKILKDGSFMLSYENKYLGKNKKDSQECHPLFYKSKTDDDDCMIDGIIVAANPITFHMIQCLMCEDSEKLTYDTGCRPYNDYCGEVMRALTELEF